MALTPQLPPTDHAALAKVTDRAERESAFQQNAIHRHERPQGTRYTKGTSPHAQRRSWQSLDAVLRSDANSSAALPVRDLRLSRVFTALTLVAGIVTIAGTAATAREGLNLNQLNGTGAIMLTGGLLTVGFGITSGIFYGRTKKGYERAVDVYNDSLGMRLGIVDADGKYIPPPGVLVDRDGYIILDEPGASRRRVAVPPKGVPALGSSPAPTPNPQADPPPDPTPAPKADPDPTVEAPASEAPADEVPPAVQTPEAQTPAVPEPAQSPGGVAAPPDADGRPLSLSGR